MISFRDFLSYRKNVWTGISCLFGLIVVALFVGLFSHTTYTRTYTYTHTITFVRINQIDENPATDQQWQSWANNWCKMRTRTTLEAVFSSIRPKEQREQLQANTTTFWSDLLSRRRTRNFARLRRVYAKLREANKKSLTLTIPTLLFQFHSYSLINILWRHLKKKKSIKNYI